MRVWAGFQDWLSAVREARRAGRGQPRCHIQPLALVPVGTGRAGLPVLPRRAQGQRKAKASFFHKPSGLIRSRSAGNLVGDFLRPKPFSFSETALAMPR